MNIREHIRTKNEAFGQIKGNLSCFIAELVKHFPERADELQKYDSKRIKAFALYLSKEIRQLSAIRLDEIASHHRLRKKIGEERWTTFY